MSVTVFSSNFLNELLSDAAQSLRARQHRNIHQSYDDPCQRLFNAIGLNSYIRPHRHCLDPKAETLIAVRGLFALITFDDDGGIQEIIRFGTEKYSGNAGLGVGVEFSPGTWHTVIALVPDAILLELKAGPFNPCAAKEPAQWAPEEQTGEGKVFLETLRNRVAGGIRNFV